MASFDDVCEALEAKDPSVSRGKMFGMPCLKAGAKAIAGEYSGDMIFKLPDEPVRKQALELEGAHLFEPMAGRPMKEWVQIPAAQSDHWKRLANEALTLRVG
jgi:hypothetical protein